MRLPLLLPPSPTHVQILRLSRLSTSSIPLKHNTLRRLRNTLNALTLTPLSHNSPISSTPVLLPELRCSSSSQQLASPALKRGGFRRELGVVNTLFLYIFGVA